MKTITVMYIVPRHRTVRTKLNIVYCYWYFFEKNNGFVAWRSFYSNSALSGSWRIEVGVFGILLLKRRLDYGSDSSS